MGKAVHALVHYLEHTSANANRVMLVMGLLVALTRTWTGIPMLKLGAQKNIARWTTVRQSQTVVKRIQIKMEKVMHVMLMTMMIRFLMWMIYVRW